MTFKLTEKDIKLIEAIVGDHASGMLADDIVAKHSIEKKAAVIAFISSLRHFGISIPRQPRGARPGSDIAKRIGDSARARWAAFREFEAREAAR